MNFRFTPLSRVLLSLSLRKDTVLGTAVTSTFRRARGGINEVYQVDPGGAAAGPNGKTEPGDVSATFHPTNCPQPGLFHREHSLCSAKSLSDWQRLLCSGPGRKLPKKC